MSLVQWEKGESHFKSAETPLSVVRHDRRKKRQDRLEDAYKAAEKRDGLRCRVTGKPLQRGATNAAERLEHHHLRKRSLSKALREKASNIVCVSKLAHDLLTAGWIECQGTDARKVLTWHWTKLAKSKPLIIRRHNPNVTSEQGRKSE